MNGRGVWEVGVNRRRFDYSPSFETRDTDGDGVTDVAVVPATGEVAYKATPPRRSYALPMLLLAVVGGGALLGRRARR